MMKTILKPLFLMFILFSMVLAADEIPNQKITSVTIDSKVIGEKRPIHIKLPANYTKEKISRRGLIGWR